MKKSKQYKSRRGVLFGSGDIVRLGLYAFPLPDKLQVHKPTYAGKVVVKAVVTGIDPVFKGIVYLEPMLGGYHSWHVDELSMVKKKVVAVRKAGK